MSKVHFFVPRESPDSSLQGILNQLTSRSPLPPFDPTLRSFVSDISKSILLDRNSRSYPELVVMANFFRSQNISSLARELADGRFVAPRGFVFHIAPSNVDSVFLYSSLLSLLCGNVNFIRISRNSSPQINFILEKIQQLLSGPHASLADRFFVVNYEHDDATTSLISSHCHMRVVWGGDATVKKIRSLPLRPTAFELCFPDRFSAAMLRAEAVLAMEDTELDSLSAKFFNDSIWFSQQACSSPRLVAWIGSTDRCESARRAFWDAFERGLQKQDFENSSGMVMDRFVTSCLVATAPHHLETSESSFPGRILFASEALGSVKDFHSGNGLFFEQRFNSVPEFFRSLTDREQTLTVFGFEAQEIEEAVRYLPMRAIDRFAPIGRALDFAHVWDGCNLLHAFTRRIDIFV